MKAKDIQIGGHYGIIHDGATVPVIVQDIQRLDFRSASFPNRRALTRFICFNTVTGRKLTIKSASRFRLLASRQCAHD